MSTDRVQDWCYELTLLFAWGFLVFSVRTLWSGSRGELCTFVLFRSKKTINKCLQISCSLLHCGFNRRVFFSLHEEPNQYRKPIVFNLIYYICFKKKKVISFVVLLYWLKTNVPTRQSLSEIFVGKFDQEFILKLSKKNSQMHFLSLMLGLAWVVLHEHLDKY